MYSDQIHWAGLLCGLKGTTAASQAHARSDLDDTRKESNRLHTCHVTGPGPWSCPLMVTACVEIALWNLTVTATDFSPVPVPVLFPAPSPFPAPAPAPVLGGVPYLSRADVSCLRSAHAHVGPSLCFPLHLQRPTKHHKQNPLRKRIKHHYH